MPDLKANENLNNRQEAQIAAFAPALEELTGQVDRIKGFNERLRVMANLEKPARQDDIFGVGGREGVISGPGVRLRPPAWSAASRCSSVTWTA